MKTFTFVLFFRRAAPVVCGAGLAVSALATDYQFNTATGDWSTAGNWSPSGNPTGGDRAQVNGGRTSDITTNFGTSGSRLADLNVGGNQYGAPAGNGTVNHSAGDVYTDWFRVGRGAANTGTYAKTGGLLNANQFFIGGENDNASGNFSQSAGTLAVNSNFRVGHSSGGAGTSRGTFTQSGGTVISAPDILVGHREGGGGFAHGTFNLSNGTLSAPQVRAGVSNAGGQAWGTINQTGGTLQITGNGFRHAQGGGTAVINLSGGTMNQPGGDTVYGEGSGGNATVNHSGTHVSNSNQTWVGYNGSRGTYNLNGGTLNIASGGNDAFNIGRQAGGTGVFNVNGGVLNMTAANARMRLGAGGTGTYNHTGGTSNLSSTWAAVDGGSTAWIDISGGNANLGALRMGQNGSTGTMLIHGGQTTSTYHELGWGSSGRVQMSSGTYTNTGDMTIGPVNGNATFDLSGGQLTNTSNFGLGRGHGQAGNSNGTFNMSGGTLNSGSAWIGLKEGNTGTSRGTFNMQGGAAAFSTLSLGHDASAQGWMNQSGGTITMSSWLGVGTNPSGTGTWNATGGVLNAGNIEIGPRTGSSGVFNISGTAQVNADGMLFSHINTGGSTLSQLNLEGGTARVDTLTLAETATDFNWGSGVLTLKTGSGTVGAADLSLGTSNSPFVAHGRQMTFQQGGYTGAGADETIATGSGINVSGTDVVGGNSVLNLGGLYLSSGVRYNKAVFNDGMSLNATAAGDTLALDTPLSNDTAYLLRPFGFFTEDYGSLPLIQFNGGGSMTGTFDTFVGLADDGKGFSLSTFSVTTATANTLALNTWYLEQTATGVFFHYKVAGIVPEPDTFALLAFSALGLRTARLLRERRRQVTPALED